MNSKQPFKWRHFQSDIILLCVRWYLRYPLSYRHLEEMMSERGLSVDHSTVYQWVQAYAPELEKRCRPQLKSTNDSWRVDETYIKVKGKWKYLYRAVDSSGNTIDFMLSAKRDKRAAKRFFRKALKVAHSQQPRVINVDTVDKGVGCPDPNNLKNAAYPIAVEELKTEEILAQACELRQNKYLNNVVEQSHRFIKQLVNPRLGFKSFHTAKRTIIGYETMNMIRKGQVNGVSKGDIVGQVKFIADIFGVVA